MSCNFTAADSAVSGDRAAGEFMLFGVRVVVDSMRKSVSLNNLSHYEIPQDASSNNNNNTSNKDAIAAGYASADDAIPHNSAKLRERKRGIPWTEEEHKLFLVGLQKVGKGDWRGISRNYVKTRTPTQVASHAQKYFLRRTNLNRRRRRSSLFDITTDTVPMEEEQTQNQDSASDSQSMCPATTEASNKNGFQVMPMYPIGVGSGMFSIQAENPMEELTLGQGIMEHNVSTNQVLLIPKATTMSNIASNSSSIMDPPTLSLGLSFSSHPQTSSRHSPLPVIPRFNNGDNIISVA
ncbi:hypothetical protein TanjilG_29057 [Lupinus angustifolius]|uniref:Uncharacterized protein n=1 Tax=Lupinus angustifolius TaxID=3871 RepID=A0A4P1RTJ2_LUPAN|nr:PREDICTED: transcription factor MYB1R1-like [Lupinus angustifolius]OIW17707.1 hypothetical protein TanjilG_29057 [Lupinus angustifolius]